MLGLLKDANLDHQDVDIGPEVAPLKDCVQLETALNRHDDSETSIDREADRNRLTESIIEDPDQDLMIARDVGALEIGLIRHREGGIADKSTCVLVIPHREDVQGLDLQFGVNPHATDQEIPRRQMIDIKAKIRLSGLIHQTVAN